MDSTTSATLLTVEDWLSYDVPEGYRAELVDGVLDMTPLAGLSHQVVLHRILRQIDAFMEAHPGIVGFWGSPARFPIPGSAKPRGREPDLGLYAQEPEDLGEDLSWSDVLPFLVAEIVSPDQEARDYADKRRDYHVARIPEYWIVDYHRRLFLALRWMEHGWDEHQISERGVYSTPRLPGFVLDVGRLWSKR